MKIRKQAFDLWGLRLALLAVSPAGGCLNEKPFTTFIHFCFKKIIKQDCEYWDYGSLCAP
jgi:hypothetical protein